MGGVGGVRLPVGGVGRVGGGSASGGGGGGRPPRGPPGAPPPPPPPPPQCPSSSWCSTHSVPATSFAGADVGASTGRPPPATAFPTPAPPSAFPTPAPPPLPLPPPAPALAFPVIPHWVWVFPPPSPPPPAGATARRGDLGPLPASGESCASPTPLEPTPNPFCGASLGFGLGWASSFALASWGCIAGAGPLAEGVTTVCSNRPNAFSSN